jgi:hypothetical protein
MVLRKHGKEREMIDINGIVNQLKAAVEILHNNRTAEANFAPETYWKQLREIDSSYCDMLLIPLRFGGPCGSDPEAVAMAIADMEEYYHVAAQMIARNAPAMAN